MRQLPGTLRFLAASESVELQTSGLTPLAWVKDEARAKITVHLYQIRDLRHDDLKNLSLKSLTLDRNLHRHLCQACDCVKLLRFRNPTPAREPLLRRSGCGLPVRILDQAVLDFQLAGFEQR